LPEPLGPMMACTSPALTSRVDALEDGLAVHIHFQILDAQHFFALATRYSKLFYPTLPSKLTPSRFWASTANSMGNSLITSLQKPLTIMDTASSADSPRCWQ